MAAVMGDIAEDPAGDLFSVSQSQTLFKIDPSTGATESTVQLHTSDGSIFPALNALEFRGDGPAGTAAPLADYIRRATSPGSQQQAVVAAKDAVFSLLA